MLRSTKATLLNANLKNANMNTFVSNTLLVVHYYLALGSQKRKTLSFDNFTGH